MKPVVRPEVFDMTKHIETAKRSLKSKASLYILLVAGVAVVIFSNLWVAPQFKKGERITEYLQNISESDIAKIELWDSLMCEKKIIVPNIDSDKSKGLFAIGMHNLESYSPNHDSAAQEFYIVMYDVQSRKYEFDTYLKDPQDQIVYLHLNERSDKDQMHWINLGARKSNSLYKWLELNNLINIGSNIYMAAEVKRKNYSLRIGSKIFLLPFIANRHNA